MEAQENEMIVYRPFRSIEECEKYLNFKCKVNGSEGVFISVRVEGKSLIFTFLIPGKGEVEYSTMSAFYLVRINGHPFGEY